MRGIVLSYGDILNGEVGGELKYNHPYPSPRPCVLSVAAERLLDIIIDRHRLLIQSRSTFCRPVFHPIDVLAFVNIALSKSC